METSDNFTPQSTPPRSNLFKFVGALVIVALIYFAGYKAGSKGFVFDPKSFEVVNKNNITATIDYNLLWDALSVVEEKYINKPIDQQKVLYGAVKGALQALGDPYTVFLPPRDLENFQTQLAGSFGGIGAEVGQKNGNIVIVAPLDDTPAKRAGILAGDIIVSVDGESVEGWSVEDAVSKIRGPKGTSVTLNLYREGKDKPFDVKITRDTIIIKSVKLSYKEVDGKTVAVIGLSDFGDDTLNLFNQAVNEVLKKNVSGIVLDLRNNPGGYLQTSVDLASFWVNEGDVVVSEEHSDGTKKEYNAERSQRLAGIKTVVLINGGSASASEILAGALRDHNISQLIGEKSFGKGSVQELVDLPGGGAVKVTIANWITPGGVNLNHNGLNPDIEVKLTEEDITNQTDPQMDKAVEELTK